MASWVTAFFDVKGTFLNERFKNNKQLYMTVPWGSKKHYPDDVLLLLLCTIYGLKQAAIQFWRELQRAFKFMKFKRNKTDPYLSFRWVDGYLMIWIMWVDDCLCAGPPDLMEKSKKEMSSMFECEELGKMQEYVGCNVDQDDDVGKIKLIQPILLQ
eukprot:434099-Ditylum_brightwellii.AAC.1